MCTLPGNLSGQKQTFANRNNPAFILSTCETAPNGTYQDAITAPSTPQVSSAKISQLIHIPLLPKRSVPDTTCVLLNAQSVGNKTMTIRPSSIRHLPFLVEIYRMSSPIPTPGLVYISTQIRPKPKPE